MTRPEHARAPQPHDGGKDGARSRIPGFPSLAASRAGQPRRARGTGRLMSYVGMAASLWVIVWVAVSTANSGGRHAPADTLFLLQR